MASDRDSDQLGANLDINDYNDGLFMLLDRKLCFLDQDLCCDIESSLLFGLLADFFSLTDSLEGDALAD